METRLQLDSQAKRLNLAFKKKLVHSSGTELKVDGWIDTTNATATLQTSLNKYIYLGAASAGLQSAYQPDTRLRLGVGAHASTTSDDIKLSLSAKKKLVLHRSEDVLRSKVVLNGYTQVVARTRYDYSTRSDAWGGEASLAVSHAMLRFTEDQDVRVTAGVRVPLYQQSTGKPEPFFRVQENCWTLNVDRHGRWSVLYDL